MSSRKPKTEPPAAAQSGLIRYSLQLTGMPPGVIFQSKGLLALGSESGGKNKVHRVPAEQARLLAHWMPGKSPNLALPWVNLYLSICAAGTNFKGVGKKSLASLLAAQLSCESDYLDLGTDEFEVYEEWVRIPPRTGPMVLYARPRLREWQTSCVLILDSEQFSDPDAQLAAVVKDAGKLVGVGAWRPQLKGPYGRFLTELKRL